MICQKMLGNKIIIYFNQNTPTCTLYNIQSVICLAELLPPMENFMSNQTDITPQMIGICHSCQVHLKFDLMAETLYLMVTLLLDHYLSEVKIKKNEMQFVGLTSLLLASKYEDFWHPRVNINMSSLHNVSSCISISYQ